MVDLQPTATIDIAKDQLAMMADLVKKAFDRSMKALTEPNILLGREVIDADKAINSYEIDIDNSTYVMLTISNMPPEMLRSIIAIQKINAMLERIGDHAVNIAESAINIVTEERDTQLLTIPEMAGLCKKILNDALASFFGKDVVLAQNVLTRDEEIDALNMGIINEVKTRVLAGALAFETAIDLIRISKNLERIADLSTNIAEETTFVVLGRVVKHNQNMSLNFEKDDGGKGESILTQS